MVLGLRTYRNYHKIIIYNYNHEYQASGFWGKLVNFIGRAILKNNK